MKISEERKFNAEKYDVYVKDYITKSEGLNNPINSSELRFFDLPDSRWFVRNCPDDSVKRWSDLRKYDYNGKPYICRRNSDRILW